jgi:Ca2+-binding RTX toxin-like protein
MGIFEDITVFGAGESARAEGPTFTPGEDEVGLALRVRAVYKDANGVLEEAFPASTGPVGDFITGTAASKTLTGRAFDDDIRGLGSADTINAGAGDDLTSGGDGNDTLNGEDGSDTFTYTLGQGTDTVQGGLGRTP